MAKPKTNELERRGFALPVPVEVRQDDGTNTIVGIASVFNQETVIGGDMFGFREQIAPGAFDGALDRPDDVRALFNHDPNQLLGRNTSGTLRLKTTKEGLRYEVDLPDTTPGRDVLAYIKRGDVNGSSFGFRVLDDEWDDSEVRTGKLPLRTITEVELWDVSPVTYPAYKQTSVSARAESRAKAIHDEQASALALRRLSQAKDEIAKRRVA